VTDEGKQNAFLDAVDVAAAIRAAVNAAGSEQAFAEKCGVSRQFINQVTRQGRQPSASILAAIGLRKIIRFQSIGSAKNG
jgi:hypothetical protein